MRLIAKKPCSFGGKIFYIGEEIPSELVINPKSQEKLGVLAIAAAGEMFDANVEKCTAEVGEVKFEIPIQQNDGTMPLLMTEEQICKAVSVLQMNATNAKEVIKGVSDETILIFLNACDSRKTVKDATEAAALKLDGEDLETEESEEPMEESEYDEESEGLPEESAGDE